MDTGTHLRAIWRRRLPVLLLALLAGAAVFALRSSTTATYRAESDLYLVPGAGQDDNAEIRRLTAFYTEIVRDPRVVADLVRRSGLDLRPGDVEDLVSVSSPESGQLRVAAEQPTAARAVALADAAGEALSAGASKDQVEAQKVELAPLTAELTALRSQLAALPAGAAGRDELQSRIDRADESRVERLAAVRTRLDLVRRAQVDDVGKTPRPARDAALAFLLVLVLAAEGAALLAVRRRGLEGGDPVPQLEAWSGLPAFRTGRSRHGPDESGALARFLCREAAGRPVYLVGLEAVAAGDAALDRVAAAVATQAPTSARVALVPDGAPLPPAEGGRGPHGAAAAVVTASSWTDDRLLDLAATAPGACGLVVLSRHVRRPRLEEALRVLRLSGLAPTCVVVDEARRRGGRSTAVQP